MQGRFFEPFECCPVLEIGFRLGQDKWKILSVVQRSRMQLHQSVASQRRGHEEQLANQGPFTPGSLLSLRCRQRFGSKAVVGSLGVLHGSHRVKNPARADGTRPWPVWESCVGGLDSLLHPARNPNANSAVHLPISRQTIAGWLRPVVPWRAEGAEAGRGNRISRGLHRASVPCASGSRGYSRFWEAPWHQWQCGDWTHAGSLGKRIGVP
jgi:hypothetical protein